MVTTAIEVSDDFLTCQRLRWPNIVFARALADAIQLAHKDCKKNNNNNKHAVDSVIILFAKCPNFLRYFSL